MPIVLSITRKELIDFAVKQYTREANVMKTGVEYTIEAIPESDHWGVGAGKRLFVSGMYPGILWQLYNYTQDNKWKVLDIKATDGLYDQQFATPGVMTSALLLNCLMVWDMISPKIVVILKLSLMLRNI